MSLENITKPNAFDIYANNLYVEGNIVGQTLPKKGFWEASINAAVPDGYKLIFMDEVVNETDLSFEAPAGEQLGGFQAGKMYHLEFKTNITGIISGDDFVVGIAKDSAPTFIDEYEQSSTVSGSFNEVVYLQYVINGDDYVGSTLEFRFDVTSGVFGSYNTSLVVTQLTKE